MAGLPIASNQATSLVRVLPTASKKVSMLGAVIEPKIGKR
jgi:hypothetical protein